MKSEVRVFCPNGHDKLTIDNQEEVAWCTKCGELNAYDFEELQIVKVVKEEVTVPYKYHQFSNGERLIYGK